MEPQPQPRSYHELPGVTEGQDYVWNPKSEQSAKETIMTKQGNVLVYWRRTGKPAFPVENSNAEVRRVEAERRETKADDPWWPIPSWEVPEGVRFDTPGRNQGQIVEVSFGTFGRAEAGSIDPYMNVRDHSGGSSRTYKRRSI